MNAYDLNIGTKLEMSLINSSGRKVGYVYTSQILDIVDESNIVLAHPLRESRLVFIPAGSRAEIILVHENHGLLSFEGIVTDRTDRENIPVINMQIDTDIERIQRRQFFRLDCYLNARYRIIEGNPQVYDMDGIPQQEEKVRYYKAVTSDLSGSGVCIITDELIPPGSTVEVHISLNDETVVKARASVIRSFRSENARKLKYKNGLHFTDISKADRDNVIRFLFNLQRELLKKGILDK